MIILHYLTADQKDPYQDWLDKIKDIKARIAIDRRIERLKINHLGDHKFCREGIFELRIDYGPGYRIYYTQEKDITIILLAGGTKRSQEKDIEKAISFLKDYKERKKRNG